MVFGKVNNSPGSRLQKPFPSTFNTTTVVGGYDRVYTVKLWRFICGITQGITHRSLRSRRFLHGVCIDPLRLLQSTDIYILVNIPDGEYTFNQSNYRNNLKKCLPMELIEFHQSASWKSVSILFRLAHFQLITNELQMKIVYFHPLAFPY